jgi:hypothetical protein
VQNVPLQRCGPDSPELTFGVFGVMHNPAEISVMPDANALSVTASVAFDGAKVCSGSCDAVKCCR